ncbi:MAG: hypothetical protein ACI9MR_002281 [Myxococcota bacterium]
MIRVRYNRIYAILLIVLSAANLVMGGITSAPTTILLGAVLTVIGILFLVQPYFVLDGGIVHVKNVYGMSMRRYDVTAYASVEVVHDGARIYFVGLDGERKRVKVTRWLSHRPDWNTFTTAIVSANAFD